MIVPIYIGDIPEEEKLGALVAESSEASTPSVERQSSLSDEMTKP